MTDDSDVSAADLHGWLDGVRFSSDSDDGLVTVTVTASGALADLRLGSRLFQTPTDPEGVAATIVEVSDRAREQASTRIAKATQSALGVGFTLEAMTNPASMSQMLTDVGGQVRKRLEEESEHD